MGGRALMASSMSRKGGWRRRWRRRGAELVLKPVRGQSLRSALRSRCGGAEAFSYDREWAAQRPPIQLQRRSIVAAPGRASPRLGAVRCNRLLCQPGATIV